MSGWQPGRRNRNSTWVCGSSTATSSLSLPGYRLAPSLLSQDMFLLLVQPHWALVVQRCGILSWNASSPAVAAGTVLLRGCQDPVYLFDVCTCQG